MLSDLLSFQMPRLRYGRLSWLLFLLITGMILASAVSNKRNSFAESTVIEIIPLEDGDKMLTDKDVRQTLLRAFGNTLEGTEMASLEVERIERVLEEDPFVLDAETYVGQNNILHIRIQQREPILRVLDNNGGNYYLDAAGAKMPTSRNYAARVLVATGNLAPYSPDFQEKRRNTLKDVFKLTQALMADDTWASFIQQVHVNNANEIILVPLIGDQKIMLGSVRNLEEKLNKLKIFYQEAMPYAGWRKYKSINLKYNGQVVCRK